jgi:hypothetical protein
MVPLLTCLLRMRARAEMIVKSGVCTTGCDERELCVNVHFAYYLRAAGMMGGKIILWLL